LLVKIGTARVDNDQMAICAGGVERLAHRRTTNLPMTPEGINHSLQLPTVFLPYWEDL
jgi:hypothetical protein